MKRQSKHDSEPERSVIELSEIQAVHGPRITKGYWDSSVRHLLLLGPNQGLKFMFHDGPAPKEIRSSIHSAAVRAGVRVGVKVSGPLVYLWKVGTRERSPKPPSRPPITCEVCGKPITPRRGTSKQIVCAGIGRQKSRCQKIRRDSREHGISIEEARARWQL